MTEATASTYHRTFSGVVKSQKTARVFVAARTYN